MRAAAVVLAGGEARRLGGVHKPALEVGGVPIVGRVVAAARQAGLPVLVVGRADGVPDGVRVVREEPPGGGPVVAVAAALRHLPDVRDVSDVSNETDVVVLLAGDLPFLTTEALTDLAAALDDPAVDLAVYRDTDGQPQWLCSAWRRTALEARLADPSAPRGIRGLASGLRRREIDDRLGVCADVDSAADLAAARAMAMAMAIAPRAYAPGMPDDPMQQLSEWAETLRRELGLEQPVDDRTIELVLSLAAVSAHSVIRPAAPVTTFLAGLALAHRPELDLDEVKRRVDRLLAERPTA